MSIATLFYIIKFKWFERMKVSMVGSIIGTVFYNIKISYYDAFYVR